MADEPRAVEDMTFKEASIELEQIVRALESGELERLANAEQRVRVLLDATDENAVTTDTSAAPSTAYLNE